VSSRKSERTIGGSDRDIITRDSENLGERDDVDTVDRELRRAQLSKQAFCSSFCDSPTLGEIPAQVHYYALPT